jgi:ribosomal 50S subunit-recycling heat shock protein
MRCDQVLHWLCLQKSRSQTARNCREERILLDGAPVRPAAPVRPENVITILNPLGDTLKRIRLLRIPERQISRKDAADYYELLNEDDAAANQVSHG